MASLLWAQPNPTTPLDTFNESKNNALLGRALSAPPDQRAGLVSQVAMTDPREALAFQGAVNQQQDSDEDRRNRQLVNMSRMLVSAPEQYRDQLYQQIKPSLAKFGLSQIPDAYTPEVGQVAQSIVDAWTPVNQQPSGLRELNGQLAIAGIKPGSADAQRAGRIAVGLDPRAVTGAVKTGMITGADGRERPYTFDPATGRYSVFDGGTWQPLGAQESAQLSGLGAGAAVGSPSPAAAPAAAPARPSIEQLTQAATRMAQTQGDSAAQSWLLQQASRYGYQPAQEPPSSTTAGLGVGRTPEDTEGAKERAKQQAQLEYLPQQEQIKTNAAIQQAGGSATAKGQAERALEQPQAQAALQDAGSNLDRMAQAATDLLNHPGLNGITSWQAKIPDIPGSDAANARAELTTLRSQIGFAVLQAMRNASKTGGALGSVSDAEGVRLENNLAALEQSQSTDAFKGNLRKIIDYAHGVKGRLSNAYAQTYPASSASPQQASPSQSSGQASIDDLLSKYQVH